MPAAPPAPRRLFLACLLAVAAVALLQLLPGLDRMDFHHEEGRRVLPAREMLASGDWVTPTLVGKPYLSKPPGIFWALAGLFRLTGSDGVLVARSLSVLATLATAIGILLFGARLFRLRAGFLAALLWLAAPETLAKGRLAEIEAPLACAVFAAVACWWLGREGGWGWRIGAGLALAAALLLKGPVALVFFLGAPLALASRRDVGGARSLFAPSLLVPLALGLALPALWVGALLAEIDPAAAAGHWGGQIGGQGGGGRSLGTYAGERVEFLFGSLLALLPSSLVLVLSFRDAPGKELWRAPAPRALLGAAAAGWLFFFLFPGTSARYVFPALPFVALVAGELLDGAAAPLAGRFDRAAFGFGVLGLLIWLAVVVGWFLPLGDVEVDGLGLLLGKLAGLTGLAVLAGRGAPRRLAGLLLIPLLAGQILTSQVEPPKAKRHARAIHAARIDAALEPGETLHVARWSNFNTLLYLEHGLVLLDDLRALPEGAAALVHARQLEQLGGGVPWPYEILVEVRVRRDDLAVVRRGASAP